jgi:hypothetical protein
MIVVERYDERDVGFMTAACWTALGDLQDAAVLIPVTARVHRQYDRIRFPRTPRVAVVEAGARILVDGVADPAWDERSVALVRECAATRAEVVARMSMLELTEPVRSGDVALVYARAAAHAAVVEFAHWCEEHGWQAVAQDGRIYVLPRGIGKAPAAARAAALVGGVIVVAAGDGLMDEDMLREAPLALTPEDGPLWASGRRFATAVSGYGPATAERIVFAAIAAVKANEHRPMPIATRHHPVPVSLQESAQ